MSMRPAPFDLLVAVSPIHDPATLRPLVDAYLEPLRALGAEPCAADVAARGRAAAVFVVTGGTEQLVLDGARFDPREPAVIVAHPGHNSLPASLEILARLQQEGGRGRIVYLRGPDDTAALATLAEALHDRAVCRALRASRIGLVGAPSDWLVASRPEPEVVRGTWGPTVVPLDLEPLLAPPDAAITAGGAAVARDFAGGALVQVEPATSDLEASGRVLAMLREVVRAERLDALTVRCFDLVVKKHMTGCLALAQLTDDGVMAGCEGDLVSTVGMLWLHHLLGAVPWMANPSRVDLDRGVLLLAHCTVPRRAVEGYRLRSHFESGLGVGVQGTFAPGPVTLVRLGGTRLEWLRAIDGTLVGNTDHADLCRTQVEVELGRVAIEAMLANPLGNHVLMVPGHHAARLRRWHEAVIA